VHIFECFDLTRFLDAAFANCKSEALHKKKENDFTGMILLTETLGIDWFRRLTTYAEKGEAFQGRSGNRWTFQTTGESCSLKANSSAGGKLFFLAGRQIVTKEHLEVSALLTDKVFPDGTPLRETIDTVRSSDAIPVLPWSFGKWWGTRGKILSEMLPCQPAEDFFLGDNSHRPSFLPSPTQFKQAEQLGIRILPGSDPFPFPSEYWRPCCAGFSVTGLVPDRTPAEDLKRLLRDPGNTLTPYIFPESFLRFCRNQMAMNILKRPFRRPT
ncbi:MAG: hypothetical protein R3351_05330, partial [Nitrospirales bacterium]|nr:hypothetical protein [Nitrospirales bacterium]